MRLKLHLLGEAYIELDGERLAMPFKKAEAVVFYLAVEGRRSKKGVSAYSGRPRRAAGIGQHANAVYLLRKTLPHNFPPARISQPYGFRCRPGRTRPLRRDTFRGIRGASSV
ncbi:MAG: hypothetical protein ACLUEQ_10695 [Cloacibacillus evryensis]